MDFADSADSADIYADQLPTAQIVLFLCCLGSWRNMNSRNPYSLVEWVIENNLVRGPSAEFPLLRRIRSSQKRGCYVTNSNQVTENNRDAVEYSRISTV